MTHRPVCVKCQIEMRPEHNDTAVVSQSSAGKELWLADLWRCPKCKHEILSGFGAAPIIYDQENLLKFSVLLEAYTRDYETFTYNEAGYDAHMASG